MNLANSEKRRSDFGRQCGNARSGLKNKSQEVGAEEKKREENSAR